MKKFESYSRVLTWFMALLLSALAAGCGGSGGRDPILGTGGSAALAPTVTAVTPLANATGVPINTKIITAAFSKAMNPLTLTTASFTLACAGIPVTGGGAVTYLAAGSVATLPLPAATNLPPSTACTATVTTVATDTTGIPLARDFVWTFTTGVTPDATRPTVTLTLPATTIPGPTAGVPTNTAIIAIFSEDMAPASIIAAGTFTVTCAAPCVSPAGTVAYAVGARTATFTPPAVLTAATTYTATITTAATDLALNALAGNQAPPLPAASNYVWTFTTAAPVAPSNVSVLSTNPAAGAGSVCPTATINATFTVPSGLRMDPLTVFAGTTFTVTGPTGAVEGTVALDPATGRIATFTPRAALAVGTYTATIVGGATGVKDLAIPANTLAAGPVSNPWTFTVVPATGACLAPLDLGAASTFGSLTCAALVGSTLGPTGTTVNGNIGTTATSTSITNFVGGGAPATPGIVNGTIFASDLPTPGNTTSATAIGAANNARLAGATAGALGTLVPTSDLGAETLFGTGVAGNFFPGAYRSGSSMAISTPITLDARGNRDAVWIFFMPSSTLTTTGTGNVLLANGAQEKNVFWVVGSSATLGAPTFSGNILAATAITVATVPTTVNGRLLTSGPSCAAVTFDAHLHTVNVP